ncbi:hypothetical protein BN8_01984 [Fibrisoma limi BUZ 3]|uniref:Uncharacterized protein n=1 Tax=Fibrisoma limi BUZ 3 TaxID=1185876 RepID=I2GGB4_9BACT|nr:hypothetical protein BN8_01984 [Fibrisoma limi BUZ 3]
MFKIRSHESTYFSKSAEITPADHGKTKGFGSKSGSFFAFTGIAPHLFYLTIPLVHTRLLASL